MTRRRRVRGEPEKPPAFQFYARAWLASTRGLSYEAKGAFIDALSWQWDNGGLPDDPRWRQAFFGSRATAARLWGQIVHKFARVDGRMVNARLEGQRAELRAFSEHAATAAAARWSASPCAKGSTEHASGMPSGMAGADAHGMPDACTPDSRLQTPNKNKPAAPGRALPFKVYAAIAMRAVVDEPSDDLGAIGERFKRLCARQHLPYDADITQRAIDAARHVRATRRA